MSEIKRPPDSTLQIAESADRIVLRGQRSLPQALSADPMAAVLWTTWIVLSLVAAVMVQVIPQLTLVFLVLAICGVYAFYAAIQRGVIEEEIVLTKDWVSLHRSPPRSSASIDLAKIVGVRVVQVGMLSRATAEWKDGATRASFDLYTLGDPADAAFVVKQVRRMCDM